MSETGSPQRPMLKPDVTHRIFSAGIHIAHRDDGFVIRNTKTAPVVARILGAVDGRRSPDQLRAALPEQVRPLLTTLLEQLGTHGMLTEGPVGVVDPSIVDTPAARLARSFEMDWEHRLASWRAEPLRISGEPDFAARVAGMVTEDGAPQSTPGASDQTLLMVLARHRPAVVARIVGVQIAVGRLEESEMGTWTTLVDAAFSSEGAPSLHTLRVAAALAAHEALLAAIDGQSPRSERAKVVGPEGTTKTIDLTAAVHSEPQPPVAPVSVAEQSNLPWLDPSGPLRRGDDVVPAFPLAHSRLVISAARGHEAVTVCEWSSSPLEADERSLARACETLAARATGLPVWRLHASRHDAVAEAALALAATRLAKAEASEIDLATLGVEAGMLARIALLHWGELPAVSIASGEGAHLARASVTGIAGVGSGQDPEAAVAQAIGNAISTLQTGLRSTGEQRLVERLAGGDADAPRLVAGPFPWDVQVAAS